MKLTRFDKVAVVVTVVLILIIAASVILIRPVEIPARIAFMAPADASLTNVVAVDPNNPENVEQLTFSEIGIYDFAPDPTGRYIAYSELSATGLTELFLLDLVNGSTRQLTDCAANDASCGGAAWRPDGKVIAYERKELNSQLGLGVSPSRIWLIDISTEPNRTFPLFEDTQILGSQPIWSGDGTRLGLYDGFGQVIMVYDFTASGEEPQVHAIGASNGSPGALSYNGNLLVYSDLVFGADTEAVRERLYIANLDESSYRALTGEDDIYDDGAYPAWQPIDAPNGGGKLAFTRQYYDADRATRGQQVYLIDPESGDVETLIFDDNYYNGAIQWNPDGTQLVIQRSPLNGGQPEIWHYDLATSGLKRVAVNGYLPRWIP